MKEIFPFNGNEITVSFGKATTVHKWGADRPQVRATISCKGFQFRTPFTGHALSLKKDITAKSILYSVASDAQAYLSSRDEAEFIVDMGMNETAHLIREGRKAYAACKRAAAFFHNIGFDTDAVNCLVSILDD